MTVAAVVAFVCGVCGSGKTTVGKALARALSASFIDADDLHPPPNLEKLRAGTPLTDADRAPWLDAVADAAAVQADAEPVVVVACSALKRAYREALRRRVVQLRATATSKAVTPLFVLLAPSERALRQRLASSNPRLATHALPDPLRLLPSQLATLERGNDDDDDEWAAVVEGEAALAPPEDLARAIARRITDAAAALALEQERRRQGG